MEKDVLGQVIEVEKEIQKRVEAEELKVREWIESVKKECREKIFIEEEKINRSMEQSLAEAAKEAGKKAEEIVNQAAAAAELLGQLKAESLIDLTEIQIAKILPG
jgi:hypothetical protein